MTPTVAVDGTLIVTACVLFVVAVAWPLRPLRHRAIASTAETAPVDDGSASDTTASTGLAARLAARLPRRVAPVEPGPLAEWCDELSRRVRAGESLRDALAGAVSHDPACRRSSSPVRHALDRGVPTDEAVHRLAGGGADLELTAAVLSTAARLGGSPAAAIDRTAAVLRQRAADRGERQVQSAQARLSAIVLTVLPVAILGLLLVADKDVRAAVVEPVGAACVIVGSALNIVGWCWMRRVIAS